MGDSVETVGQAIDRIPIGTFHWTLMAVMGSMWAAIAFSTLSISFVLPDLISLWNLSGLDAGVLGSSSLFGMLLGNFFGGRYADQYGRKRMIVISTVVFSVFTAVTGLAIDFYSAMLFRFLTGLGLGGALVAGASYTSEHLPTDRRGRYITYLEAFFSVGSIVTVIVAWVILSAFATGGTTFGVASWRLFFGIGIFPLAIGLLVFRYSPTSPYFLAQKAEMGGAIERIRAMARINGSPDPVGSSTLSHDRQTGSGIRQLLRQPLLKTTLLMAAIWFSVNLAYYGIFTWIPNTVIEAGYVENLYRYLLIVACFQLFGQLSSAYLIDVLGRKWTLSSLFVLGGLSISVFAVSLSGPELGWVSRELVFMVGLFAMGFSLFGAWAVLYAYTSEVFPTEVRSTGLGVSGSVGKVAAVIGPIQFGSLLGAGYQTALLPIAVTLFLSAGLLLVFGAETQGHTLK